MPKTPSVHQVTQLTLIGEGGTKEDKINAAKHLAECKKCQLEVRSVWETTERARRAVKWWIKKARTKLKGNHYATRPIAPPTAGLSADGQPFMPSGERL